MIERIAWRLGWEFRRNLLGRVYMIVRRIEWMPDAKQQLFENGETMRTQADRDDDLAIGREFERRDAEIDRLRTALKPFAEAVTASIQDGETYYSVPSDRRRPPLTDLMRARRVYDGHQQSTTEVK